MKLFYRTVGKGEPVVILHGLFGMGDNWISIARRIGQNYKVYLPDARNHGRSPHSDTFNTRVLKEDLAQFISDRALENVKLIGHSLGGKVAMLYALEHPENVEKLVVVDIAPKSYFRPYFKLFLEQLMRLPMADMSSRQEVDQALAKAITQPAIRNFLLKNLARDGNNRFYWRINLPGIYNNLSNVMDFESGKNTFEKDTLFIRGGASDYVTDQDVPLIKRYFPNARVETIPGATHWLHAEKPDEFCNHLKTFFKGEE